MKIFKYLLILTGLTGVGLAKAQEVDFALYAPTGLIVNTAAAGKLVVKRYTDKWHAYPANTTYDEANLTGIARDDYVTHSYHLSIDTKTADNTLLRTYITIAKTTASCVVPTKSSIGVKGFYYEISTHTEDVNASASRLTSYGPEVKVCSSVDLLTLHFGKIINGYLLPMTWAGYAPNRSRSAEIVQYVPIVLDWKGARNEE